MINQLKELKVSIDNLISVYEDDSYTDNDSELILIEFLAEVNDLKKD